jgi:thioredoxin reductase (NADPH)
MVRERLGMMERPFLAAMTALSSPTLETRRAQMLPELTGEEIARIRRFGVVRRYADGERLFEAGKTRSGMFVVLSGLVRVTRRDALGHEETLFKQGVGQFLAEVGQLSSRPSFVDGTAVGDVETLLVAPDQLRALLVAEAGLGERIMRALILRRVALIEMGAVGPVLIGSSWSADVVRLRGFLSRNGHPHQLLDPDSDEDAKAFIERYAPSTDDLPLVVCPDGTVLRNPAESVLGRCIGMLDVRNIDGVYDLAVVGAGPAGLAAAVYAASDGWSVVAIDARAYGGQAGASARIENYLGFPTGISGQALAGRAVVQAQKFGVRLLSPSEVTGLECDRAVPSEPVTLTLSDGRAIRSRTLVIATGARYRRPDCAHLRDVEGRGVWYWASPIEAKMCASQEVALVGGGNSAGQAAVFLAGHVAKVWMLVRGAGLAASMSRYLIDRIGATANIELHTRAEIVAISVSQETGLEAVTWRHHDTGREETRLLRHVFLFLGADPATDWLKDCGVAVDGKGFITTGSPRDIVSTGRLALESSVPGVFAIGDVRAGSVKRVGGAIGEGAAVVAQIHAFLAQQEARTAV